MKNVQYSTAAISGNVFVMRPITEVRKAGGTQLLANRIVTEPFSYPNCVTKHTIFISNVIFCDTFCVDSVFGNENIIFEDCTFNMRAAFKNFKNSKLIIRNCTFNNELRIDNVQTGNLELFNTTHYDDIIVNNVKADFYFTDNVKIIGSHLLFLNDSSIKYCMKH